MILLYTAERKAYLGFIPNDQVAFVDRLRKVIQQQKINLAQNKTQGGPVAGPSAASTSNPNQQQQNLMMSQANTIQMTCGQVSQNTVTSSASSAAMGGLFTQNMRQNAMRMHVGI